MLSVEGSPSCAVPMPTLMTEVPWAFSALAEKMPFSTSANRVVLPRPPLPVGP